MAIFHFYNGLDGNCIIRFCSNSREYGNPTVFPSISAKPYFLTLAPLARTL